VDRAPKSSRGRKGSDGDDADGGHRSLFTRDGITLRRAANDNRLGLKGWLERLAAPVLLIGLAALLAWKIAG
jgi:hypothetical protein